MNQSTTAATQTVTIITEASHRNAHTPFTGAEYPVAGRSHPSCHNHSSTSLNDRYTGAMTDSAEAIARVVRDINQKRIVTPPGGPGSDNMPTFLNTPTVDMTAIYNDFVTSNKPHALYEDSLGRPPFNHANLAYVNQHGNVYVMKYVSVDRQRDYVSDDLLLNTFTTLRWETDENEVRWDEIRWISLMGFWIGGMSDGKHMPTTGPYIYVFMAMYDSGEIADIHWRGDNHDLFQFPLDIALQAITVLNCRNVEIMEPVSRTKPERKRLARTGISVSEIHVTKLGRYRRQTGPKRLGDGVPLSTVRGHLARYGPQHGRGKLFGKYEGEFWIPVHLRGDRDLGETQQNYDVG